MVQKLVKFRIQTSEHDDSWRRTYHITYCRCRAQLMLTTMSTASLTGGGNIVDLLGEPRCWHGMVRSTCKL